MGELTACAEAVPSHNAPATVLVVDDDIRLLRVTAAMLDAEGYRVLKALGPEEAVRVFEQAPAEIDLLLSDVMMPGMTGPELEARLRRVRPDLAVVFMTGQPERVAAPGKLLEKPFGMHDLRESVAGALGSLSYLPSGRPQRQ